MSSLETLLAMLAYRRPAWSKSERRFIREYLEPLGLQTDRQGNLFKRIGDAPVMWSAHTDTVHKQGGTQRLTVTRGIVAVADKLSNCLGADNTAGVWLLREMILANRPGLYIFHRGEEVGGIGSDYIASETPHLVDGIQYAIAFDRRGRQSIITHQWGGRCCSDAFADALGLALGLGHRKDDGGSFTDTANYVDLIGECTNVSVGYDHEHSAKETLALNYLFRLRTALLALDAETLPCVRMPGEDEDEAAEAIAWEKVFDGEDQAPRVRDSLDLYRLCRDYPAEVADVLEEYGINAWDIEDAITARGMTLRRR